MAVVIRLQGLRVTAGSEDIRSFFTGLRIPDGGVHIIGGELGEAFIIFASDEDARRAMTRSGGCIKGSPINLLLSSKSEMHNVLEASTKRKPELNAKRVYKEGARRPAVNSGPSPFREKAKMRRADLEMGNRLGSATHPGQMREAVVENSKGSCLQLIGMPFSTTKENVRLFFEGLQIEDIIFLRNHRGMFNGCGLVKFATKEDAVEGMKRDRQYIGQRFIKLKPCTEQQWLKASGSVQSDLRRNYAPDRSRSRSPFAYRSRSQSQSPPKEELCVLLENLSYAVEKRDIKEFFHPIALKDEQIVYVLDKEGNRMRAVILVLGNLKDYCTCLAQHKRSFRNRTLYASPISREKMVAMLAREDHRRYSRSSERSEPREDLRESERRCLYVRNLPFDVRKVEITDFFHGFRLSEDKVILLRDERGAGLGEALLIFQTEEEASMAQSLNGQRFLGSEVMLKCISWAQVREFGVMDQVMDDPLETNSPRSFTETYGDEPRFPCDGMHPDAMVRQDVYDRLSDMPSYGSGHQFESPLDSRDKFRGQVDETSHRGLGPSGQQFDGPTCLKLLNLPLPITIDEIYDFCYGYKVIPGSVSLQYDRNGVPKGSATVVFECHSEAVTAVRELSGRPIGTRKIKVVFV
ncbi:RNA binding motif protein 12Bb [Chanos chanos]|uniref:RNA binding motif protein 12Bb n=1 Tax=Chanos chanos TaxID=29144 RepID=A0A6J2W4T7_CHACN|nr:RNA-binding protein 12B [Chanos chanos]